MIEHHQGDDVAVRRQVALGVEAIGQIDNVRAGVPVEILVPAVRANGHVSHVPLRAVLARRALEAGMQLAAEDIVVTHGCIEALNIALRAVAQPGDTIAVESPTYYGLLQVLESLGLRALEIPTSPSTGISIEALDLAFQTHDNWNGDVDLLHDSSGRKPFA